MARWAHSVLRIVLRKDPSRSGRNAFWRQCVTSSNSNLGEPHGKLCRVPFSFSACRPETEERQTFELDARRMGIFQHHLLESFHLTLQEEGKQWHDLTAGQGAELLSHLAEQMIHDFDDGLLEDKATNQLMAKAMTQGLRIFIEVLMGWMKHYPYEPRAVELSFGQRIPAST